jgi:hypothetical protein
MNSAHVVARLRPGAGGMPWRRETLPTVEALFAEDMHAKRVRSLANAMLGVMTSASLAVSTIGRGLAYGEESCEATPRPPGNDWEPAYLGGRLPKEIVDEIDRFAKREKISRGEAILARTRGTQIVGVNSATGGKPIDLRCLLQGPTPTQRCSNPVRCIHRRLLNWQWRTVL